MCAAALALAAGHTAAFVPQSTSSSIPAQAHGQIRRCSQQTHHQQQQSHVYTQQTHHQQLLSNAPITTAAAASPAATSTSLSLAPAAAISRAISSLPVIPSIVRKIILLGAAIALSLNLKRILYPNIVRDAAVDEPLPPGKLGCPLFGNQIFVGSKKFGTGYFWHRMSKALGAPRVWMVYFLGRPGAVITGGDNIKNLLNTEFDDDGVENGVNPSGMLDENSMLAEKDRRMHSYMRRLVGNAMTPAAVTKAVPNLREAAEKQVDAILQDGFANSEATCTAYTLDVAWKQILGLNLSEDEVPVFSQMVDQWIAGFADLRVVFNVFPKRSPAFRAKKWLTDKIEEKIDQLESNGPDASTLSAMVYATDDATEGTDGNRKLTREQIVENSLVLILAGSETSASTLTNALLFLGLSPDKWTKLVEEQRDMMANHGDVMTRDLLDKECPYLEGVIKETMRLKPLSSGAPRTLKSTVTIDGYQIPKGWGVNWNVLLTHENDPITYKEDGSHMDVKDGFQPERWLDETTRPSTDFIPMGAGPRYCLGSTLAYTEMKVFLATLARRMDFDLADENLKSGEDVEWKRMSIIPLPKDGVPIEVKPALVQKAKEAVVAA